VAINDNELGIKSTIPKRKASQLLNLCGEPKLGMKADLFPYLAFAHDPPIEWFKGQCRELLNLQIATHGVHPHGRYALIVQPLLT
jgi:hypothetical protein